MSKLFFQAYVMVRYVFNLVPTVPPVKSQHFQFFQLLLTAALDPFHGLSVEDYGFSSISVFIFLFFA